MIQKQLTRTGKCRVPADGAFAEVGNQASRRVEMVGALSREQIGLLRNQGQTLKEIGQAAGVTKERIRQVCDQLGIDSRRIAGIRQTAKEAKVVKEFSSYTRKAAAEARAAGGDPVPLSCREFSIQGVRYQVRQISKLCTLEKGQIP